MVIVDEIILYPNARPPFDKGSCHMSTDGDIEELHAFAARIGMRRSWFQDHPSMPHYDLTPKRREAAIRAGATFVSWRQLAQERRAKKMAKRLAEGSDL